MSKKVKTKVKIKALVEAPHVVSWDQDYRDYNVPRRRNGALKVRRFYRAYETRSLALKAIFNMQGAAKGDFFTDEGEGKTRNILLHALDAGQAIKLKIGEEVVE